MLRLLARRLSSQLCPRDMISITSKTTSETPVFSDRGLAIISTSVRSASADRLCLENNPSINLEQVVLGCGTSELKSRIELQSGHMSWKETLNLLDQVNTPLEFATYASLLQCCSDAKALSDGKRIHCHIIKRGLEQCIILASTILQMYINCGVLEEALELFAGMRLKNTFTWNVIIRAYARLKNGREALQLFGQMREEAILPNKVTYVSVFDACASESVLATGERMHVSIICSEFEGDVIVETALINMYGKCNSLNRAVMIFSKMSERNVVSWTAMITAFEQNGQGKQALQHFERMQQEGILPNQITFGSVLAACAGIVAFITGKRLHACVHNSGFELELVVGTALVNMYGKCNSLENAKMVFDSMPKRNVVAWTTIIAVCSQCGQGKKAFQLFDQMHQEKVMPNNATFVNILSACTDPAMIVEGKWMDDCIHTKGFESDIVVGTALVNMYAKCGSLEDAQMTFDNLSKWDVISWNAMIAACVEHGQVKRALELLDQMQTWNVKPNKITFISILAACASQQALPRGNQIHNCILQFGLESEVAVGNALVNMYGLCASLEDARRTFDNMNERNLVSWSAMISVYAQHGCGREALDLFAQMFKGGLTPDKITFINVLVACSHAGLVTEAHDCFASIKQDYGIYPVADHYVCMIDMLGKTGCLDEAENWINDMPFQPAVIPFMAFLGACRHHNDVDRGERFAICARELDPKSVTPYLMLSNIYAAAVR